MANEIQFSLLVAALKNGVNVTTGTQQGFRDMTGSEMLTNVQTVGTSPEAVVVGDVTTPGLWFLRNAGTTGNLLISLDNASADLFSTLNPGEFCLLNRAPATLYAAASAGTISLHVVLIEV